MQHRKGGNVQEEPQTEYKIVRKPKPPPPAMNRDPSRPYDPAPFRVKPSYPSADDALTDLLTLRGTVDDPDEYVVVEVETTVDEQGTRQLAPRRTIEERKPPVRPL